MLLSEDAILTRYYMCINIRLIFLRTTVKQHQGSHKGVTHKCKFCDEVFK